MKPLIKVAPLLLVFALASCTTETTQQNEQPTSRLDKMLEPHDHFSFVRSYPDEQPDVDAYHLAMRQASRALNSPERSTGDFGLQWTTQGPGNIGARINTITLPHRLSDTIYIGYARGGIYRTYDFGQTWTSIFDDYPTLKISNITIDPNNPNVIYAATGDRNIPGAFNLGDGIYKSIDAGDNWVYSGMRETKIVTDILIDYSNSNTIYAGAMGIPSAPDTNRGLYKSTDGGTTWNKSLFISDSAGIVDLMLHPSDPNIIYAASWNRIRNNKRSIVEGPDAKIWKTTNGGQTWTALGGGLPTGVQGRIGLSMFEQNPDTIYANYVDTGNQLGGVFISYDAGSSWTALDIDPATGLDDNALGGFGWYFGEIQVNPFDYQEVMFGGVDIWRTRNLGQSWGRAATPWFFYDVHADKHDIFYRSQYSWLLATDGGLYLTSDSGANYTKMENNTTNEIYRVAHSHLRPDRYFCGMQDQGSSGGNLNYINQWPRIYGGDGFQMQFHPTDSNTFYAETQRGRLYATDDNGFNWNRISFDWEDDRSNWDSPYFQSRYSQFEMYFGTYRVWKNGFAPQSAWSSISPDLTDGIIYGSAYHTISALAESPKSKNIIIAGTSDANVWYTDDDGANWNQINAGLPERYVTSVAASVVYRDRFFVTHSGYRNTEYIPHVHRSDDKGQTWIDITANLPDLAVNDILIYPNSEDSIMFVATDGGVYGTIDAATTWQRVGTNMPLVGTSHLEIDTVNNRLIAGTFGKSLQTYPLDSFSIIPSIIDTIANDTTTVGIFNTPKGNDQFFLVTNPVKNQIRIGYNGTLTFEEIKVIDMNGKLLYQGQTDLQKGSVTSIDCSEFEAGQYMVITESGAVMKVLKP